MNNNVQEKMINAAKWSLGAEILAKLITPFTSMVLARILAPEEFGIVATVNMIISLADLLTDSGFSKYLVQHKFDNENELFEYSNTAFWSNLGISFMLWGIIVIFSTPLANLVGASGYELAIIISASKLIVTSFSGIQRAIYQRKFDYKTIFKIRLIVSLIPIFVTIPLSLLGCSYWSLIIATILNEAVYAIILTIKSSWTPKLYYSLEKLIKMLSFSIWSLFEQFTIWVTTYR